MTTSAGLVLFRERGDGGGLEVLLGHMGGPTARWSSSGEVRQKAGKRVIAFAVEGRSRLLERLAEARSG